jgi:hypothetical protein
MRCRLAPLGVIAAMGAYGSSRLVPTTKPQPDGRLAKALARAWRWQRMLDEGVYTSVSEIGDAEKISKSYVSRILRLALLAPDIIEAILTAGELGGAVRPHSRGPDVVSPLAVLSEEVVHPG